MTTRFKIIPYKPKSAGGRNLKEGLENILDYEVERPATDYYAQTDDWIICWGAGNWHGLRKNYSKNVRIFNPPKKIALCVNKIDFFKVMDGAGVAIPKWTTCIDEAKTWTKAEKKTYCRVDVEGRDGRGIVVASSPSELEWAPLYTQAVDATEEYRVHIFQHEPIFDLEKWKEHATAEDKEVRSGGKGWIYVRDTVVPTKAKNEAVKASKALGMDFVAIDVLYNSKTGKAVVLEANTAPELGPHTRKAYAQKFVALTK